MFLRRSAFTKFRGFGVFFLYLPRKPDKPEKILQVLGCGVRGSEIGSEYCNWHVSPSELETVNVSGCAVNEFSGN